MTTLMLLTIVLFVLMLTIGRQNGLKAFIGLFINISLLGIAVMLIVLKMNVIIIAILFGMVMAVFNIIVINKYNEVSRTAILSTGITFIIITVLIYISVTYGMIQGFPLEEGDEIAAYSLNIGINFVHVALFVMLISTLGAVIDIAVSIATTMEEVDKQYPHITSKQLIRSGLHVAADILGTTTNTLFFAYLGSYITLFIWFDKLNYSFGQIINSKVFASEVMTMLIGGIAVAIAIPLTCVIGAALLMRKRPPIR